MLTVGCRQWADFERTGILGSTENLVPTVVGCGKAVTGWEMVLCTGFFFLVFVPEDPFDIGT